MTDEQTPEPLPLDTAMSAPAGVLEQISPLVRRLVAPNGGPFTFTGTCTYIVGQGSVAIIDPGPDSPGHIAALLKAVRGHSVSHLVITHTHRDHSPAARAIVKATGAKIVGCAPHIAARDIALGETSLLDASNDHDHAPHMIMQDGDVLAGGGFNLRALATPGHTMNHLAFRLEEENSLFSGDHVMAWSTTIVAPPDGSMGAFMASLDSLRGRPEETYWPGHGGPVREPQRFVRGLINHRRAREASILTRLRAGDRQIGDIVMSIYTGLNPALRGAAALSVFAHLEDLVARGLATSDGPPLLGGQYRAA